MKKKCILSFKYIFRNKKDVFYLLVIGLAISMLVIATFYKYTVLNYAENGLKNNRTYRILELNYGTKLLPENNELPYTARKQQIASVNHVTGVFNDYSFQTGVIFEEFITEKLDGMIWIYATNNNTLPEIVQGTNFPDYNHNYIICPENFYPLGGNSEGIIDLSKNDRIDLTEYIGNTLTYTYYALSSDGLSEKQLSTDFTLVGTYKNNPNTVDEGQCFVTEVAIEEILSNYNTEDTISERFYIEVDDYDNLESVKQILNEKYGIVANNISKLVPEFFESAEQSSSFYVSIIFAFTIILLIVISFKQFKESTPYYRLLHHIGYSKKDISQIYLINSIFKILFSFIITITGIILIKIGINTYLTYYPFKFYKWQIIIKYQEVLILMIITIITVLAISLINIRKLNKNNFLE